MKKTLFLISFITCINLIQAQKTNNTDDMVATCIGGIDSFNEMWNLPVSKEKVLATLEGGGSKYLPVLVLTDKNIQSSVFFIRISDNLFYVLGYAPLISGNNYTNIGRVYLTRRLDGKTSIVADKTRKLGQMVVKNENYEFIDEPEVYVALYNKSIAITLEIREIGMKLFIPETYFKWK